MVRDRDASGISALLSDDAVMHSPVVHTPLVGRAIVTKYLEAALYVFGSPSFRYVRETVAADHAVLEFTSEVDGITVNGVDIISWNSAELITDFKVMVRPFKAINLIHEKMAALMQPKR